MKPQLLRVILTCIWPLFVSRAPNNGAPASSDSYQAFHNEIPHCTSGTKAQWWKTLKQHTYSCGNEMTPADRLKPAESHSYALRGTLETASTRAFLLPTPHQMHCPPIVGRTEIVHGLSNLGDRFPCLTNTWAMLLTSLVGASPFSLLAV